jgi:hypothetical protein
MLLSVDGEEILQAHSDERCWHCEMACGISNVQYLMTVISVEREIKE